jgi:ketosteroid isomerase-like protein
MTSTADALAVADALTAAIHARSTEKINAVYADDIEVWHGAFGKGMGKKENAALLDSLFKITSRLEYQEIRRHPIEGGVVQQHVLVGTFSDGKPMPSLQACLVMKVRGGKLVRIDEYFDSQSFAEVWQRLEAAAK